MVSKLTRYAGAAGLTIVTGIASAQVAGTTDGDEAPRLEEIVVTAQKRAENLQTVPISIVALGAPRMQAMGVTETQDLPALVPGLVITKSLNIALPYLRGVGQSSATIGIESNVALYIDGVYLSEPAAGIFSLNDVSQIAVLKGPQGTLFGRNATGGVVQVTTKDPSSQAGAESDLSYGNYQTYSGHFFGTMPLNDSLSASLAAGGERRNEGYVRNIFLSQDTFTSTEANIQGKLLWHASEDTKVLLNALYTYGEGYEGTGLGIYPGSLAENHVTRYLGPYTVDDALSGDSRTEHALVSINVDHDFGWSRLVNLSAVRTEEESIEFTQNAIPDGTHKATNAFFPGEGADSFSNELQLQSTEGGAIPWVAGLYYFHNRSFLNANIDVDTTPIFHIRSSQLTNSYAGFLQATKTIVPDTRLTLGARYTIDEKSVQGQRRNSAGVVTQTFAGDLAAIGAPTSERWSRPTFRVAVDHDFAKDVLGYVSYNRNFKSGVYNLLSLSNPAAQPETLNAYETGLKTQFFDRRLRLNIAGFYYDYSNIQLRSLVPPNPVPLLYNAAKSTIRGADVDFEWAATSALLFTGGFEYLHAQYDRFPDGSCAVPAVTGGNPTTVACDLSGKTMIRSPKYTGNVGAEYTFGLPNDASINLSVNESYNSGFYWEPDNRLRQNAYSLVSASARWNLPGKHYSVELWGKNLSNAIVWVNAASASSDTFAPGQPRTYGVTARYKF